MQGQPRQGNKSWDRETSATARLAELASKQGTGQHRPISTSAGKPGTIPQRPPHMPPHLDSRPEMARAPRPRHVAPEPKKMRPFLIVLGAIVAIIIIFVVVIATLLINALNQGAGPATTTTNFLSALSNKDYNGAYQYLGAGVTIRLNRDEFTKQAEALDQTYGPITNYSEVDGSATVNANNTESFTYNITRTNANNKVTTYKLTITLQQSPNDNNTWQIVDFGPTLGPTQS